MRSATRPIPSRMGARRFALAASLALALATMLPFGGTAHTCVPDAEVGVGGRLLVPRASGLAIVSLPEREQRSVPVLPVQGVITAVSSSPDRALLAVSRFWRPADHQIDGQDILIVGADGGEPVGAISRGRPGEQLGSPTWLPDGSLVYERREVGSGGDTARIERRAIDGTESPLLFAGSASTGLVDGASSPAVSPDGTLLAFLRGDQSDRLVVRDLAGGPERTLAQDSKLLGLAFPRFSPDGAWIAFAAVTDPALGADPRDPLASWLTTALPGSGAGLINRLGAGASWLGVRAARAHGLPWDIFVVRTDGSDARRVTYFYDDDPAAAWSPDGRWLVTFSGEALHVVALDGAANYCLAGEGGYGALEWLP